MQRNCRGVAQEWLENAKRMAQVLHWSGVGMAKEGIGVAQEWHRSGIGMAKNRYRNGIGMRKGWHRNGIGVV